MEVAERSFVPDSLAAFPRLTTVWPNPPVQSSATPSHLTTTPVVVSEPNPVTPPSPSWVPSGASAFFDFQKGNYFAGGKIVTDLTTCFAANAALGSTFNPAHISSAGLAQDVPQFIGPLQTLCLAGVTLVMQTNSTYGSAWSHGWANPELDIISDTDWTTFYFAGAADPLSHQADSVQNATQLGDVNTNHIAANVFANSGNRNRAAFTLSPIDMAVSVNGSATFSVPTIPGWNKMTIASLEGTYDYLEAMVFYPPADPSSLSRLSTVPADLVTNNKPPPGPKSSALFHFDGNFNDSSGNGHTLINHGGVTTTTSQFKFGTSSAQLSGSNWLQNTDASLTFGLGDFTIDFWFKLQSAPTGQVNLYFFDDNAQVYIYILSDEIGLYAGVWGGPLIQGPQTIAANTWYHVALTNASGSVRMFCNGVQQGTTHPTTYNLSNPDIVIGGGQASGSGGPVMWIDELRIIVGTAAWTANFTPPTAAYTV